MACRPRLHGKEGRFLPLDSRRAGNINKISPSSERPILFGPSSLDLAQYGTQWSTEVGVQHLAGRYLNPPSPWPALGFDLHFVAGC